MSIAITHTLSSAELYALDQLASAEMEGGPLPEGFKDLALEYARGELTEEAFMSEAIKRYG